MFIAYNVLVDLVSRLDKKDQSVIEKQYWNTVKGLLCKLFSYFIVLFKNDVYRKESDSK